LEKLFFSTINCFQIIRNFTWFNSIMKIEASSFWFDLSSWIWV
jgi:hypothetical protein